MIQLLLKLTLVAIITVAFFALVAAVLSISDSRLVELFALLLWSCGAVPLVYLVWRLDLQR